MRTQRPGPDAGRNEPPDALDRDDTAGYGHLTGGAGANAIDRLAHDPETDEGESLGVGGDQHSFADEEPRTDAGENYHGMNDPA